MSTSNDLVPPEQQQSAFVPLDSTQSSPSTSPGEVAVVFGSTGACGKHILTRLLDSPEISQVYSFVRKPTNRFTDNPKHHEIVMRQPDATLPLSNYNILNFPQTAPLTAEQLTNDQLLSGLEQDLKDNWPADQVGVVFSSLAISVKAAGTDERKYTVDYKMNDLISTYAKEKQVPSYYIISSLGANSLSNFFYLRIKGQLDDRIDALDFEHSKIYRPGFLSGAERTEFNLGEWVLENLVTPVYPTSYCSPTSYFGQAGPIHIKDVGHSMVSDFLQFTYEKQSNLAQPDINIHQSVDLPSVKDPLTRPKLHSIVEGSGEIMQGLLRSEAFLQGIPHRGQTPAAIELTKASL